MRDTPPPAPARVAWLIKRLRCMTPAEIGYRLGRAGADALARCLPRAPVPAPTALPALPRFEAPALDAAATAAILADAERIRAGQVTLFAAHRFDVGAPPCWNRDPYSGVTGPAWRAGAIDIADGRLVGDIKHVWELNRHLQLVRLAQAYAISADPLYAHALRRQLRSWLDQCPPSTGPNWTSALEMAIRLINWSLVWRLFGGREEALFGGADGAVLRADWLASIYAHCRFIARHPSRHSSANNHLIGEMAGLYLAAITWPCWPACTRWRARAHAALLRQAQAQYTRDGVNREQAFSYHILSAEFLFVAGLAGQGGGQPFPAAYWDVLQRALRFLRSVRDVGGQLPLVGDADDAMVHRFDPRPVGADRAGELLALGESLFGAAPTAHIAHIANIADTAHAAYAAHTAHAAHAAHAAVRWLLHALPGARPAVDPLAPATCWAFPDGGYLLFGADFGGPREIKGLLDCGPLGYLGIAAHGHADALALTLSVGGEPCLIDSGTYSYASWRAHAWRDYFRGTSAHNTLRVDRLDQSVGGGRFLWLRKAAVAIERMPRSPGAFVFRGAHDGYLRLSDPVRHVRTVRFDARAACLTVSDRVSASQPHLLEQFWHFAPGLAVVLGTATVQVRGRRFALRIAISGPALRLELLRGADHPPLGWYAPAYETKQACTVLKISSTSHAAPIACRFTITFFQ